MDHVRKNMLMMPVFEMASLMVACGSRVTCDPAPTDTDEDYLVRIESSRWNDLRDFLETTGWELGGEDYAVDDPRFSFQSWTFEDLNLIICDSLEFYDRHNLATHVCKTMNVMVKEHRVMIFQAILYGTTYHPVPTEEIK